MGTKRTEVRGSGGKPLELFATTDGLTLRGGLEIWRLSWAQLDELRPKSAPTKPRKPILRERASRCPASFPLTEERLRWANTNGAATLALGRETEQFLDHHRAKGSLFVSWDAAWHTWIRNAVKFSAERAIARPSEPQRHTRSLNEQAESSLAAMILAGESDTDEARELRRRLGENTTTGRNRSVLARPHA